MSTAEPQNKLVILFENVYSALDDTFVDAEQLTNHNVSTVYYISSNSEPDVISPYDNSITFNNIKIDFNYLYTPEVVFLTQTINNVLQALRPTERGALIQCSGPDQYLASVIGLYYCIHIPEYEYIEYETFKKLIQLSRPNLNIQDNLVMYIKSEDVN